MSRNTLVRSLLALFLTLAAPGCDRERVAEEGCAPSMGALAPTDGSSYKVDAGQVTRFHAESQSCSAAVSYGVRWQLDGEIVAYANDYDYIACNEDEGVHKLAAQAVTYETTTTATVEKVVASHTWAIAVRGVAKPTPPKCYAESIRSVQTTNNADDPAEQKKLAAAVTCLDTYLKTYACDFKASYASGLAQAALLGESFYPIYLRRQSLTLDDVKKIVSDEIEPIRQKFLVVQQKAPDDFSFKVDGTFKIYAFKDDPGLDGNDEIVFKAYGRHDKGEAQFITTFMNFFDGFVKVGLANQGSIEFGLHTPDNETPVSISERLITALEKDPRFFTHDDGVDADGNPLNDGSGAEGRRLIAISKNSFIQGVANIINTFKRIQSEEHDQSLDLARYWDCGEDAVCPAKCDYMSGYFNDNELPDAPEHRPEFANCEAADGGYNDINLNGKCDDGWVKADAGECNSKYDDGEALGTDRIYTGGRTKPERIGPSMDMEKVIKVLEIIRENIRGPEWLDLDEIAGIAADTPPKAVASFMEGLSVPYPMVRISEFFTTPTQFRDLVPLYDKKALQFLIGLENEPFEDSGYDWLFSEEETGFDDVAKIDPNFDDFDPYCNPDCNEKDAKDNDGDGKTDYADRAYGFTKDFGVEGNFVFDFIDLKDGATGKFNSLHDVNETVHEDFKDVGTVNAAGKLIGKGDGKWNKADRAHEWPTGSNVGPVSAAREEDPPNGVLLEQPVGLYDPYYYFLQDPTISGFVRFVVNPYDPEKEMESANGKVLTENARLMRFMNKLVEYAAEPPIDGIDPVRESNAHYCETDLNTCNHWKVPSEGYK